MASERTSRSAFIGAGWFAALFAACCVAVEGLSQRPAEPEASRATHGIRSTDRHDAPKRLPRGVTARDVLRAGAPDPAVSAAPRGPAPVGAAQPTAVARPVAPQLPAPASAGAAPADSSSEGRDVIAPSAAATASPDNQPLPVAGIRLAAPLAIDVTPPAAAVQGEPAVFTVRIANPNMFVVDGVSVMAEFDDGWEHAGSDDPRLQLRVGALPAESARDMSLTLTPLRAGTLTFQLRMIGGDQPAAPTPATVVVQPRLVDLELTGPPRRGTGQRAEHVVTLVNVAGRELPEARVDVEYDPAALVVREASTGALHRPGAIAWPLGALLRDERVQIQMEFECVGEAAQSPVRCMFSTGGHRVITRETRLDVVPPRVVDIAIVDRNDPVPAGATARFQITVRNLGAAPLDDLQLRLTASPHFERPVLATPSPLTAASEDAYGIDLRAAALAPGAELTFEATARAALPGAGMLRVLVRTIRAPAPFEVAESAVVNPPGPDGGGPVSPQSGETGRSP